MATNYTTNYDLCQWEPTDAVQRLEFNADNAKLDAALKSLSDQIIQKANQSAVNTLVTAVNQKADASTVTALAQTVAAKADQTALEDAVDTLRGESCLVRLTQTAVESSASSHSLTVPDWDDAWELQIRYNITGAGEIWIDFNNGTSCFDPSVGLSTTGILLQEEGGACCCGVVCLRMCGTSGPLIGYVNGAAYGGQSVYDSSTVNRSYVLRNLSRDGLTSVQFRSDGGAIQAGSRVGFFKVR